MVVGCVWVVDNEVSVEVYGVVFDDVVVVCVEVGGEDGDGGGYGGGIFDFGLLIEEV